MPLKTIALAALALAAPALGVTVSFDEAYDNGSASLATVACSDGINGLLSQGAPPFPRPARPC